MDESELAGIYRRYAPLIHARAKRLVGSDADDVVHDAFVRFLRKPPRHDALLGWFYVTSTNLCMDRIRRRARRDPAWWRNVLEVAPRSSSVEDSAIGRDICLKLLSRLDSRTQRIAVLTYFDGMSVTEVASVLGISRKTVANRLAQFRKRAELLDSRWQKEAACLPI